MKTRDRVFEAIRDFWKVNGYSPSLSEIQQMVGLSSKSVAEYHVKKLVEEHRIQRRPFTARSLVIVEEGEDE